MELGVLSREHEKMSNELVPEIHDIFKLLGEKYNQYHWSPCACRDLNSIKDSSPNLWKVLSHHCTWDVEKYKENHKCKPYPLDIETFVISFADTRASMISRRLQGIYKSETVFKVWKHNLDSLKPPCKHILECKPDELIKEVKGCKDSEALRLFEKYREKEFEVRSEDTAGKYPFASLYTHCILVKRWHEFFIENSNYFEIPLQIETLDKSIELKYKILMGKPIYFVRLKLRTSTNLARLRDTKVFKDIPQIIRDISKDVKGSVLYSLGEERERVFKGDEVLLVTVFPEQEIIEKIKNRLSSNYFMEIKIAETLLYNNHDAKNDQESKEIPEKKEWFEKNFSRLFDDFDERIYPKLDPVIKAADNEAGDKAIICDLCQKGQAEKIYPSEELSPETQAQEYLCSKCHQMRKEADKTKSFQGWGEDEEDGEKRDNKACFIMVTLDMDKLSKILPDLFNKMFKEKLVLFSDLGLPVLNEFLEDYKKFLKEFRTQILNSKEVDSKEEILDNLFCIKIQGSDEVSKELRGVVEKYTAIFDRYFKCEIKPPIRLSVTCANAKFPFFKHWQLLDNPKKSINIHLINRASLEINFSQLQLLQKVNLKNVSTFLHKLVQIERRTKSRLMVEMTMIKERKRLGELYQYFMTQELSSKDILGYYKILGERDE